MNTLPEAAQQALEAMRRGVPTGDITLVDWYRAIAALEGALEQPEQDTDCHAQGICQRSGYGIKQPGQPQEATRLRDLLKRIRQWDALDIPDTDGAFWKRQIDAALEQPEQDPDRWGEGYEAGYAAGVAEHFRRLREGGPNMK